ncbi:LPXTG-motif cell wall-anchored protein [Catenuloplanes nepalensis]|uniref:LPXTG-motif cell wall-anchored protein n=1 Tax=Catenuloplanes nepalensis TaxID=587533 RepID=A0ABT9MUL3_9ACTN|nr:LPXTG cell wall anchor domain-containing protein [Catenuloplanes nepalensis]MDP9794928.1 LPXTG-motif cell wall-anchored protein [Catenuloplanes nepalensis]
MRWKMSAGVLVALAFLIPAAPAAAQAAQPGLDAACQTVERKAYTDIRKLVTIDLDTATDVEVRVLANQIMSAAKAETLPILTGAVQERLDGTEDELRAFLKEDAQKAWSVDLRVSVTRTLTDAGTNVEAVAQETLRGEGIDAYLTYLNDGLYSARALDCKTRPTATPTVTPSATTSATPTSTPTAPTTPTTAAPGGEGGGLPVTGADTGTVAAIGGALLLLGGLGYLIGRRRRSRFVA